MELAPGASIGPALAFFAAIVALTIAAAHRAARRTRSAREFYAAGRSIPAWQNGLALAGEYLSAASFLGIAGLIALRGYDGVIYATGWLMGWPALLFFVAEPLRNVGTFTPADVVAFRLRQRPVRMAAAAGALATALVHAIPQVVGAGTLVALLFGIDYRAAVLLSGLLMLVFVLPGGMIATTWVQIVKAGLLLSGVLVLGVLVLTRVGFSVDRLSLAVAARYGQAALEPGGIVAGPLDGISLGLALMFGLLGLPHILMRFFTVRDAREARVSVVYATGFVGAFYLLIPIAGFGAAAFVGRDAIAALDAGGNMALPLLAAHLGGAPLIGFVSAVAFAAILAVVSGLTLAGASALSHDLYVHALRQGAPPEGEQVRVARLSALAFGAVVILLGLAFEGHNVAFLVGLAYAVAASANFPALLLAIVWRRYTTRGAVCSIATGLIASFGLILLSPTVWIDLFGYPEAVFPLRNPAIVSMPASFAAGVLASLWWPEREAEVRFVDLRLRAYLGVGAE